MTLRDVPFDTRVVLRAYFMLVGGIGLILFLWGPMFLRTSLTNDPWSQVVIIRLIGGVMTAAAASARGFALVEDPATRHRALFWFLLGHVALFCVLFTQITGPGIPGPGDLAFYGLCAAIVLLLYFWRTSDGYRGSAMFARTPSASERVRSAYEEGIRQAAGQEERNRLARELHDSIKQQIFVMQTSAATAQARFDADPPGAKAALQQLRDAARDAMTEMEAMLDNLRATPLENLGLVEALRKQCEALALRTGAEVGFEPGTLPPSASLRPGAQQGIFRVAQESLANIGRHARARRVRVALESVDCEVVLDIEDDGAGFEPETAGQGMGLRNMRARAEAMNGRLCVTSRPGGGTEVRLSVPFERPAAHGLRRRVVISTAIIASLFLARVVLEVVLFNRLMIGVADVLFLFVVGVILRREWALYRRAAARSKAACLESPSHS